MYYDFQIHHELYFQSHHYDDNYGYEYYDQHMDYDTNVSIFVHIYIWFVYMRWKQN